MPAVITLRAGRYPGGFSQPPHAHEELHLSLVLCGAVRERVGASAVEAGPLCVVLKDPGVVHDNTFGPAGATLASLRFRGPVTTLLGIEPGELRWLWTRDAAVAARFLQLARRAAQGATHLAVGDVEVQALLGALAVARRFGPAGEPPPWLQRVMHQLRSRWRPGQRVAALAHAAGVHRVHLARSVRRWYGHGVRDELRWLRLGAAVDALAGAATISAVAHATGYADESHLCREFRDALGTTPGRYRGLVAAVANVQGT